MTAITGEGSKRMFLTLDGLMYQINENRDGFSRQELISDISSLLTKSVFKDFQDFFKTESNNEILDSVKTSIKDNLSCRLPQMICDVLFPLIMSYFSLYLQNSRYLFFLILFELDFNPTGS